MSTLITAILVIALLGFVVYLITTYIPMPQPFRQVIIVVLVIGIVIWLLSLLGVMPDLGLHIK